MDDGGPDLCGIGFGLLSAEAIRNQSVVEVRDGVTHFKNRPRPNGPVDRRFGTCTRFELCATCKNSVRTCPGHPGHLELPYPVPHVMFLTPLTRLLNVFCFNCAAYLLPPTAVPAALRNPKARLAASHEEAKRLRSLKRTPLLCPNPACGVPQPTVVLEEPFFKLVWHGDLARRFFRMPALPAAPLAGGSSHARSAAKRRAPARGRAGRSTRAPGPLRALSAAQRAAVLAEARARPRAARSLYLHTQAQGCVRADADVLLQADPLLSLGAEARATALVVELTAHLSAPAPPSDLGHHLLALADALEWTVGRAEQSWRVARLRGPAPPAPLAALLARWDPYAGLASLADPQGDPDGALDPAGALTLAEALLSDRAAVAAAAAGEEPAGGPELASAGLLVAPPDRAEAAARTRAQAVLAHLDALLAAPRLAAARDAVRALHAEFAAVVERPYSNWDAFYTLRAVRAADLAHLGFNVARTQPASMLLLNMVVPSIAIRPSVAYDEGSLRGGHDKLTREVADVVKDVNRVVAEAATCRLDLAAAEAHRLPALPDTLRETIMRLYHTLSEYMVKGKCRVPGLKLSTYALRSKANAPSLGASMVGKEGYGRNKLQGKRTNFSMRTVVTPFPLGDIDEIGVPDVLADTLTVPARVHPGNLAWLEDLLRQGHVKAVLDTDTDTRIRVTAHNRATLPLSMGWMVERTLQDGDALATNRQPTLHRPSIMAHRVRRHPGKTLLLHQSVTIPYNADHDGDEMNGHVPQTLEAQAELLELLAVQRHLMHPRATRPVVGLIQDAVLAAFYLTQQDTFLTRGQAMNLVMEMRFDPAACGLGRDVRDPRAVRGAARLPLPAILRPEPLWTGKQLVSMCLPPLHLHRRVRRPGAASEPAPGEDPALAADGWVRVRRGQLVQGSLCKQTVSDVANGVIHVACVYHGNVAAARMISDLQRVFNRFFSTFGFSVGVGDMALDPRTNARIDAQVAGAGAHVQALHAAAAGWGDDLKVQAALEAQVSATLRAAASNCSNLMGPALPASNRLGAMTIVAGSKGGPFNVLQIGGLVGQQFVNGQRPAAGRPDRARSLACEPLRSQPPLGVAADLAQRGFVTRCFKQGLTPLQAFTHCMGGREGLVDTSTKTATTGYMQRQMVKVVESHRLDHDQTVRNAHQHLFQMYFGGDGLDPTRLVLVTLDALLLDDAALAQALVAPGRRATPAGRAEAAVAAALRDRVRATKLALTHAHLPNVLKVSLPWDAAVLMEEQQASCGDPACRARRRRVGDAELGRALARLEALCRQLDREVPCLHARFHLRCLWGTQPLAARWRCCPACFEGACQRALRLHRKARMSPGEAVGANAANSMGEPTTQMTLNTFHFSGKGCKAVSEGVPRMRELIGASRNISTPWLTLPLAGDRGATRAAADLLARGLPHTLLRHVVACATAVHEEDPLRPTGPDAAMVLRHAPFLRHAAGRCSAWTLRFELHRPRTELRGLTPRAVANVVNDHLGLGAVVVASDVRDAAWVVRVYLLDLAPLAADTVAATARRPGRAADRRVTQRRYSVQRLSAAVARAQHPLAALAGDADALPQLAPSRGAVRRAGGGGCGRPGTRRARPRAPGLHLPLYRADPSVRTGQASTQRCVEWLLARNLQRDLMGRLTVGGLPGVRDAQVRLQQRTVLGPGPGEARTASEFVVDVLGCGVGQLALLPLVDRARLVSNDVLDVYLHYGVDAAAAVLYHELCTCLASAGRVDERLVKLIVDAMTHDGHPCSISRHGINKGNKHNVLAKITFEDVLEMLQEAASYGAGDPLTGVSECIMLGRQPCLGTGHVRLYTPGPDGLEPCRNQAIRSTGGPPTADLEVLTSVLVDSGGAPLGQPASPRPSSPPPDALSPPAPAVPRGFRPATPQLTIDKERLRGHVRLGPGPFNPESPARAALPPAAARAHS